MLILFISLYFIVTIAIGFYANRKISGGQDFINAGRNLNPVLNAFALFALWFGSETLFGASSEFASHGLRGVIEDPFGGILCLLLVGIFYSRKMYRLNVLTIGDVFRLRYGPRIEIVASLLMILSFLGYIAGQLLSLALLFNVLIGTGIITGLLLSAAIVMSYTVAGGMLALTLTDFIQSIMIILGLVAIGFYLQHQIGVIDTVWRTIPQDHIKFFPPSGTVHWINWCAAWSVLGLGSIVSQDIFQRVNSARSEKAAFASSIAGAMLYGILAFIPIYLIIMAKILYPEHFEGDMQMSLSQVVLNKMPITIQILFFGSVISAVLSTASGALLAPASLLSENVLKPIFFNEITDKKLLYITRLSIVALTIISVIIASRSETIFGLVGESSAFGLVSIFVPFTAALFFNYANKGAALTSMILGTLVWSYCKFSIETVINPLVYGTIASCMGLAFGHLIYKPK